MSSSKYVSSVLVISCQSSAPSDLPTLLGLVRLLAGVELGPLGVVLLVLPVRAKHPVPPGEGGRIVAQEVEVVEVVELGTCRHHRQ